MNNITYGSYGSYCSYFQKMKSYDNHVPISVTAVPVESYQDFSHATAPIYTAQPQINEGGAREFLSTYPYSWPKGLQDTFINSLGKFPIRFFVCDDSGSVIIIY